MRRLDARTHRPQRSRDHQHLRPQTTTSEHERRRTDHELRVRRSGACCPMTAMP